MSNNLRSDLTVFDFKSLIGDPGMKSRKFEKVFKSVLKVVLAKILEDHEKFADS